MTKKQLVEMIRRVVREESTFSGSIEKELALMSGLRLNKVVEFLNDNNIDKVLLLQDLKTKKFSPLDMMTAIVGKPNNKYFKNMISKYSKK